MLARFRTIFQFSTKIVLARFVHDRARLRNERCTKIVHEARFDFEHDFQPCSGPFNLIWTYCRWFGITKLVIPWFMMGARFVQPYRTSVSRTPYPLVLPSLSATMTKPWKKYWRKIWMGVLKVTHQTVNVSHTLCFMTWSSCHLESKFWTIWYGSYNMKHVAYII